MDQLKAKQRPLKAFQTNDGNRAMSVRWIVVQITLSHSNEKKKMYFPRKGNEIQNVKKSMKKYFSKIIPTKSLSI
jgi:hypothetical protein